MPAKSQNNDVTNSDEFFNFYSQLQQSCLYYSNLALRQMMVGYNNQHQNQNSVASTLCGGGRGDAIHKLTKKNIRRKLEFEAEEDKNDKNVISVQNSMPFRAPPLKKTPVMVIVSNCDTGDSREVSDVENDILGSRRRRVYFANPLSTVKFKSPTPIHSMEELNGQLLDSTRTGFTSDSEDGSDTEMLCNYFQRVQYESREEGQLQVPNGGGGVGVGCKKRKKRRKKNKNRKQEENEYYTDEYQNLWPLEAGEGDVNEQDPNAMYEMPLNEVDYEFVSEIRLCGEQKSEDKDNNSTPTCKGADGGSGDGRSEKATEMQVLYGESGSMRIIKMEETIEKWFMQSSRKIYNRKY